MCTPVQAGVIGGVSAIANIVGEGQNARAVNSFNRSQFEVNKEEALRSMVQEITGLQRRVVEERVATAQGLQGLFAEAAEAVGTIKAGSASVQGESIDTLVRDLQRQESIRIAVANANLLNSENRLGEEMEAVRARTQSRITGGIGQPVRPPSLLNAAIQIGTSGLQNFGMAGGFRQ